MAQSVAHKYACEWVQTNYELHEEGVVAKGVMYKRYEEYCIHIGRDIIETSNFGRAVKAVFPEVNIRRLGGRDNLKYHYCGIRAQASSPFASDNDNTTRPKRKRKQRPMNADPAEVDGCVDWLQQNYALEVEGKVVLCDMYNRYRSSRVAWESDMLTEEQLGEITMRCFRGITKRKISKSPQQPTLLFIGLAERDPNSISVPSEIISMLGLHTTSRSLNSSYQYAAGALEERDFCPSPESEEGSDVSAGTENSNFMDINSDSMPGFSTSFTYSCDPAAVKNEPVDYSLPESYRSRGDPTNEEMDVVKHEVSSPPSLYGSYERPPPHILGSPTPSPSPPLKTSRNKIYKPKFHALQDWNSDNAPDVKMEPENLCLSDIRNASSLCLSDIRKASSTSVCRQWLVECLEEADDRCVNRSQVFHHYERYCEQTNSKSVGYMTFDDIIKGTFTKTDILGLGVEEQATVYSGLRVIRNSDIDGRVAELAQCEPQQLCEPQNISQSWDTRSDNSPTDPSSSPITIDDDDEDENETFMVHSYREPIEDDIQSIPEILRDGKYYLRRWLMDNFEAVPEACLLKSDAHCHYVEYAKSIGQTPLEMNVFGKMVRDVFQNISARRLGGRNNPKYHYCGIAAKSTSPLFAVLSGKDPAQRSRKKEIATDNPASEFAINWLNRNYEACKESIIPKSSVLKEYTSYCNARGENPVNINYFGKLVKHCFPSVEIRKFGGRSDPNWCYHGLSPTDPSLMDQAMSIQDFHSQSNSQYSKSSSHSPQHYPIPNASLHHSNPIAVPGGGLNPMSSSLCSNPSSPYNPSTPSSPYHPSHLLGSHYLHSQLLRQQHEQQQQQQQLGLATSPSSFQQPYVLPSSPDAYPRSPGLSQAFREDLHTHTPVDDSRMGIPSPYEPEQPQDPLYCRSPDTAQSLPSVDLSHLRLSSSAGSPGALPAAAFATKRVAAGGGAAPQCQAAFSHKRAKHQLAAHYAPQFSGRS